MPVNPQRNLADALRRSQSAAADHILRFSQLSRADRELLVRRGFLFEIIKGWYALMTPQAQPGDTTFWHLHYWSFAAAYLKSRYGARYCVSAEHSLDLWTESTNIPRQLVVTTARSGTFSLNLPNGSSILIYPGRRSLPKGLEVKTGRADHAVVRRARESHPVVLHEVRGQRRTGFAHGAGRGPFSRPPD